VVPHLSGTENSSGLGTLPNITRPTGSHHLSVRPIPADCAVTSSFPGYSHVWIASFLVRTCWGIEIARHANIGPGLYIGHFGGIVISPQAVIGTECTVSHGVTIGSSGEGSESGVPVIGDQCYIAPGAKLFGKIRVGNNVKIGANAVIHKDLPDNAIAVLSPGFEIISFKGNIRS
jgi:serine O-acetyltransferase